MLKEVAVNNGFFWIYRYEYDGNGNLMERLDESIQGVKKARRFRYDSKERLTHLTDEAGATTRLFYDRNDKDLMHHKLRWLR